MLGRAAAGPGMVPGEGVPLAIFTQNITGPIFFEIIQPKGSELDSCGAECSSTAPL